MNKDRKIFVAGHRGLVGAALVRRLRNEGYTNLVSAPRSELDLTDQKATFDFLEAMKPDYIFITAAKVGGIHANNTYRAQFIYENLTIVGNLIHGAYLAGIQDLLFLGSSCIYPRVSPQPMREECLLTSALEPTNEPYAIAKIAGLKLCESYNQQYNTNYISGMPTNLYGIGDNFSLENSHVIPALIRKCHEAKKNSLASVEVWGTGKPTREFLYVDDLAAGCVFLMENGNASVLGNQHINIGTGVEVSIGELAHSVKQAVGYQGALRFESSKPDGAPRKLLDVSRLAELGWRASTSLEEGLKETYAWFLDNQDSFRR